nr:Protein MKS-6 [Haemonchus contortus]
MPDRPSYVKVLIAFDPPMVPPRITAPRRAGAVESEKVLSQCNAWVKACSAMYESRRYTALVTDINGKAILACRFLGPVNPPSSVPHPSSSPMQTIEVAARLVSMVPFVVDPVLFPGSVDLWTTTEKFLSLGCGDEEEHATLLCCWLLSFGIPCCLVLGFALPEGAQAAYVFVNLSDGIYFVNPCDGSIYSSTDAMCPLTSVGTIITPKNLYGNIQSSAHPSQLQFDLSKSSDWRPLFDREMDEIQTIQSPSIPYSQVSEDALIELRSSIEREIKLRFDEARQYGIPQWNLMVSRLLREILQDNQRSVDDRLARLRESYAVTLCTVTIPYRNMKDCVAAVLRCGLHTTTSASPQFALAVHLQSAFGHVISCSIAIALLTLKR